MTRLHKVSDPKIFLAQTMHGVTRVEYSDDYNQAVRYLPETVKCIKLGRKFNRYAGHLPPGLQELSLGEGFCHPLCTAFQGHRQSLLPETLTKLVLSCRTFSRPLTALPAHLVELRIDQQGMLSHETELCPGFLDSLPAGLRRLTVHAHSFNQRVDRLPAGLTELCLGESFNQTLDHLPQSLQSLSLGWKFNRPLDNLPSNLNILRVAGLFAQSLELLPRGLLELHMECPYYSAPLGPLPSNLRLFSFWCGKFNAEVILPASLADLIFVCYSFQQPLVLPHSVKNVKLFVRSLPNLVNDNFFPRSVKCVDATIVRHNNDLATRTSLSGRVLWFPSSTGIYAHFVAKPYPLPIADGLRLASRWCICHCGIDP